MSQSVGLALQAVVDELETIVHDFKILRARQWLGEVFDMDACIQATVDQLGALVRDTFDSLGVNLHDPIEARAARVTFLLVQSTELDNLPWLLAALGTALAP